MRKRKSVRMRKRKSESDGVRKVIVGCLSGKAK